MKIDYLIAAFLVPLSLYKETWLELPILLILSLLHPFQSCDKINFMELKNFGSKNTHIRAYKKKIPGVAAAV